MCSSLRTKKVGVDYWSFGGIITVSHSCLSLKWNMTFSTMSHTQRSSSSFLRVVPSSFRMKNQSSLLPLSSPPSPPRPLAPSSVPITTLHRDPHCQADSSHKDVIKDFCLTNINTQIFGLKCKQDVGLLNLQAAGDAWRNITFPVF